MNRKRLNGHMPKTIDVEALRKVIGVVEADKLVLTLMMAEGGAISLRQEQLDMAHRLLDGEPMGIGATQLIPVVRKFFAEQHKARELFGQWLEGVEAVIKQAQQRIEEPGR